MVVMGVSGCGKSTVGRALAEALHLPFQDGDDLHPLRNVVKMRQGEALDDTDRWPWLDRCAKALRESPGGLVLGCSALRRSYRDRLLQGARPAGLIFVHLDGSPETLGARMSARQNHFMPAALLRSQLSTLEPLAPDERALVVSIDQPVAEVVAEILRRLATAKFNPMPTSDRRSR